MNPGLVKPAGEIDPDVFVLYAESSDGTPLATWVNFTLHADTVGGDVLTADFPFFLTQFLQRQKGRHMTIMFAPGCCANINHVDVTSSDPQYSFDEAQRIGNILGAEVLRTYETLEEITDATIRPVSKVLQVKRYHPTRLEIASARKVIRQASTPKKKTKYLFEQPDSVWQFFGAQKVLAVDRLRQNTLPAEVMACRIGNIALAALPGEVFVELGRQIKQKSPFPITMVQELSNANSVGDGIGSYIPSRKAFRESGYEPARSWAAPGTGERLVHAALELLQDLKN
jgi:hypothetical protein